MATSTTRQRLSREERRENLLDAAAGLVVEEGPDAITMEGVAARAGVSKALPYAYFENADDVLEALFEREIGELDRQVTTRLVEAGSIEEQIRLTLDTWFDVVKEKGPLVGALLNIRSGPVAEHNTKRSDVAAAYWGSEIAKEFGVSEREATVAAAIMLAGSLAVIDRWIRGKGKRSDLVNTYVRMAVNVPRALRDGG